MFEVLCFSVALAGSALAGLYDLKTTEIPDWVSLGMIVLGLGINAVYSLVEWDPMFFLYSASVGSAFFAMGFLMYLSGQWGGGDAKVLAGVGTLLPVAPAFGASELLLPLPISFFINLFMVGAVYMIVYSVVFAIGRGAVLEEFVKKMKEGWQNLLLIILASIGVTVALSALMYSQFYVYNLMLLPVGVPGLFVLWKFLRSVEESGFIREIDSEDLQPGDMLADPAEEIDESHDEDGEMREVSLVLLSLVLVPASMYYLGFSGFYFYISLLSPLCGGLIFLFHLASKKLGFSIHRLFKTSSTRIRGVTEEEVEKIKEENDKVKIRGGVRFTPVFPMAVLATVYLGNLILFLI